MAASSSRQRFQWPAILMRDLETEYHTLPLGEQLVIVAGKNDDGSISLPNPQVQGFQTGQRLSFYVPVDALEIGDRNLEQGTLVKVNSMAVDGDFSDDGLNIQVNERFGEHLLFLARSLRANIGALKALLCNKRSIGLLENKFTETFNTIYNSIDNQTKQVLSRDIIDLKELVPVVTINGAQQVVQDDTTGARQFLVYLRLYLMQAHDSDLEPDGIYVGQTIDLRSRNLGHKYKTRDVAGSHYEIAAAALETRVIILATPDIKRRGALNIAEQLFVLFFDSYISRLKGNPDIISSKSPFHTSQSIILRKVMDVALEQSPYHPTFTRQIDGCNVQCPLYAPIKYPPAHWSCTELPDRFHFTCNSTRVVEKGRHWPRITIISHKEKPIKALLPRDHTLAFQEGICKVYVTVEIMKDNVSHTHPFARCPKLGCVSDMHVANTVCIQVKGKDSSGKLISYYCQVITPERRKTISVNGDKVDVPFGYFQSMAIRNTFMRQNLGPGVDYRLKGKRLEVWRYNKSFLQNKVDVVLMKEDIGIYPAPQLVSAEENKKIMADSYGIDADSPSNPSRKWCDLCDLSSRKWRLGSMKRPVQSKTIDCKVENGICKNWRWVCLPATFSTPEQLEEYKDLFFAARKATYQLSLPASGEPMETFGPAVPEMDDTLDVDEPDSDDSAASDIGEEDPGLDEDVDNDEELYDEDELEENQAEADLVSVPISSLVEEKTDTTINDRIVYVLSSKQERGQTLLLVVLNDEQNFPVWVDVEDLAHERTALVEVYKRWTDPNFPSWARGIRKRKRDDEDDNDEGEEEDGDVQEEDMDDEDNDDDD